MSEVLSLLQSLIRCPSVTPNDAGCQQIVAEYLQRQGFTIEPMQIGEVKNLWATHGTEGPTLVFNGHTDVVPTGPEDAWTSPPFEPAVREGKMYGRGACDMKASVAAMTVAFSRLAQDGHPGRVGILLTSDEEGPGLDGTRAALKQLLDRGERIDGAIVGEPTSEERFGDAVKSGRRGSMTGEMAVEGKQGHTAYPDKAMNAIHRAAELVTELQRIDWGEPAAGFPQTTLQATALEAGAGASNVIPGWARLQINVRFGPSLELSDVLDKVKEVAERHWVREIDWSISATPFATEPGWLLEALTASVEEVCGLPPKRSNGGGTSDARFFASHQIPVAEFGPLNDSIHAIDEHVAVDCLEPLAEIYALAARKFLSGS